MSLKYVTCTITDMHDTTNIMPDMSIEKGEDIPIEQRPASEVTEMWYKQPMAPAGVKVYNPAFDFADHELIYGIVTEYGIARPPYTESLKEIFRKKAEAQAKK